MFSPNIIRKKAQAHLRQLYPARTDDLYITEVFKRHKQTWSVPLHSRRAEWPVGNIVLTYSGDEVLWSTDERAIAQSIARQIRVQNFAQHHAHAH